MARVAVVTDSTVNLPKDQLEKLNITSIPLTLIWGTETYQDTVDIQPKDFYERLKVAKMMPTTSQPSPALFSAAYRRLLESGCEILSIHISSDLSGTLQSAIQSKAEFGGAPIELMDSRTTSLAMGFQVLAAATAAAAGASLKECHEAAEQARKNSGILFVVDTLEFLHRGGRIGGAARFLGTALGLKPILELRDGRIEAIERVPTQKRAFNRLFELIEQRVNGRPPASMAVLDANAPDVNKLLCARVEERYHPPSIIISEVSPVIGAHTGPGTAGIGYLKG